MASVIHSSAAHGGAINERRRQKTELIKLLLGKSSTCEFLPRIRKELSRLVHADRKEHDGTTCRPVGDILHWQALIHGAAGTPFEGSTFILDVRLPQRYPFEEPKIRFDTKVWHPSVCPETGVICPGKLDWLQWSPASRIRTMILAVESLLSCPVPSFEWQTKARLWAQQFARPPCKCRFCQKRLEALAMALHPRLGGQRSSLDQLPEDLVQQIASFATVSRSSSCRAWVEKHFLGEWA